MQKKQNNNSLFDMAEGEVILPPTDQWQLVVHSLIFPFPELSIGSFWHKYRVSKLSSRLGEIERDYNIQLVSREQKKFTNQFGVKSSYTVYKNILPINEYIDLYKKMKKK